MTASSSDGYPSYATLREVAGAQRFVLWMFLAGIVIFWVNRLFGEGGPAVALLLVVGTQMVTAVAAYRLGRALGLGAPFLWAFGAFFPYLGLVFLVVLSGKATRFLRRCGVRVGFMGAKLGPRPPPGVRVTELSDALS